ncbi:MAG: addiction module antitoxin RelB [Deltaproteobacteria bacterium CG_4_10_14_0_2_um_filter_43_8]|nr:MAG: addiction module antitoxin RelB [Deltaproteobacteria bacterium CG11_big_fil_rev_8_21_14_0_20_42_23]PJA19300.1 MAG: addiction module antitoxin RelB [Deltaproteobacteria bacterium CG_4_10_14_0_2_um_filter_43_8]PJC63430.1 MAG: addiction module antitoxin RelB [Deltaproteobacteria bacterium CG_4_9_14_0_2_um_filter_42_21]
MIEIRKTETFALWLDGLKDIQARARVLTRIERMAAGNPGDVKAVAQGISEMRIHYGPGYRIYFTKRGNEIVILLAGGSKRSQAKDIKTALSLALNL